MSNTTNINNIHTLFTQQKGSAMWDYISWQRDVCLGINFIRKNAVWLNWDGVSRNADLPWSIEFIDEYAERWNWKILSENLANNKDKILFAELLEKYGCQLSWNPICGGSAITPSLAQRHNKHINWQWLSSNQNFAWSMEFVEMYKHKIDWLNFTDLFSHHVNLWKRISMIDFLRAFRDYINWNSFSNSDFITITPQMLEEFKDKWDWYALSYHQSINWTEELSARFGHYISCHTEDTIKSTHAWHCLGEQEFKRFVKANPNFGEKLMK